MECICSCGKTHFVDSGNLRNGNTKYCTRCAALMRGKRLKKPYRDHRVKNVWRAMISRCNNKKNKSYQRYGGSGVKVCDKWMKSLESFVEDMGLPDDGMSIDRIDPAGDYEPQNCRWADKYTQANNKKNHHYVTAWGRTQTLGQWCRELGLNYDLIKARLNVHKIPPEIALLNKDLTKKNTYRILGMEYNSLQQAANALEMSVSGIHARIKSENWPNWRKV